MYNNETFEDLMNEINNIAKELGFKNGIDWAAKKHNAGMITFSTYKSYENCHDLRVRFSHGGARDISISNSTLQIAEQFLRAIKGSTTRRVKKDPVLPDGTFRWFKEFFWDGVNGLKYRFAFDIVNENNYMDDGNGGRYADGFFIHILDAPYFSYASERLHTFHLIKVGADKFHICWNKPIKTFQEANAVMFVWVKRYAAMIDDIIKEKESSEEELIRKANKRALLPVGTFRLNNNKKKFRTNRNFETGRKKNIFKPQRKTIYIKENVYNEIISKLGTQRPELGGMLGWTEDQSVIDNFVFDPKANVNDVEYNPNVNFLNSVITGEWEKKNINLAGFVHSHPVNFNCLSSADVEYAVRIMKEFEAPYLFMPIVTSSYAYKTTFNPYIIYSNGIVQKCDLVIEKEIQSEKVEQIEGVDNFLTEMDFSEDLLKSIEANFDMMAESSNVEINETTLDQNSIYARISSVIDIEYMKKCAVVGVGCGGSRGFYEDMARLGVGNFYLIDGDKYSKSNIASQNGYLSDVGKPKPEVIKSCLLNIDSDINVKTFNVMLDETITDEWFYDNIIKNHDKTKIILCAFTDDFFAQKRVCELALKYDVPYIEGQHHQFGHTSELIYYYPGVSKYSSKDILKNRYESYKNGFKNNVTSVGSPIFNTTRLNALCEKIALGILLYDKEKETKGNYSNFIIYNSKCNLILIRQKDLYFTDSTLEGLFPDNNFIFDDIVWVNPEELK